jgi:ABC-2 type transport system ATP-binding protein
MAARCGSSADVWADPVAAKALIGVLPDGMALPDRLSGREVLLYLGLLRGMPREVVAERAGELLQVLELDDAEGTAVVDYSTGMRKKITLATALLHNRRLLLLDEPFEAVDPVSAATVRTILQRFVARGGSVIFSGHVMALVERLCDHVAVIAKGTVVASGPLEEVRGGQPLEDAFVDIVGTRAGGWPVLRVSIAGADRVAHLKSVTRGSVAGDTAGTFLGAPEKGRQPRVLPQSPASLPQAARIA